MATRAVVLVEDEDEEEDEGRWPIEITPYIPQEEFDVLTLPKTTACQAGDVEAVRMSLSETVTECRVSIC